MQAAKSASTHTARSVGETGKNPSPNSASKMGQPPAAKRQTLFPGGKAAASARPRVYPPIGHAAFPTTRNASLPRRPVRSARAGTEPLPPSVTEAGPSVDGDSIGADCAKQLRKVEKKIREAMRLQEQQPKGQALVPAELAKVESLSALEAEVTPLRAPTTRTRGWASATSAAASSAAATYRNARAGLSLPDQPSTQAGTRASHIVITQRLAAERAVLETERVARAERAGAAEHKLLLMLRVRPSTREVMQSSGS